MSKTLWNRYFFGLAVITTLALMVWIAGVKAQNANAQGTITGTWTATANPEKSKIQLQLERKNERGEGKNQHGSSFEYSELQGLTHDQAMRGGPVSFSLAREAGRVEFEGSFQAGKGSGTFRFTGNPGFISAMKNRGFNFDRVADDDELHPESRLFTAAMVNVTTALADDLGAAFTDLKVGDLFKAAIFKVDGPFIREMKATGFNDLGLEDLVKARIFKVDAEFVRKVSEMGFDKEPFESLVKMQIFKVTPEFVAEVRSEGLTNLEVEDVVKLRIFKIDVEFIRKARADGDPIDVESLVQKRIGVARRH